MPNVYLEFNGSTNYTASSTLFNSTTGIFSVSVTPPNITDTTSVSHKWYINFTNVNGTPTNTLINSSPKNQILYLVSVGECTGIHTHPILNISYEDEVNGGSINVSNDYDLTFYDGTYNYNESGGFVSLGLHSFCTNIDPNDLVYNWEMYGGFSIGDGTIARRNYNFDPAVPVSVSNDPTALLTLYTILLNDSSTVTYQWLSRNFQPLDGTLRIFKCNPNGTQELVETTPIVDGRAVANINLVFTQYSYDVIVDGVLYQDPTGYGRCHVESTTDPKYYVNINNIDPSPAIGLYLVDCLLTKDDDNGTVTMAFNDNSESTEALVGCMYAYRQDIYNTTIIETVCTTEPQRSLTHTFTIGGNDVTIKGYLQQGSNQGVCRNEISFIEKSDTAIAFGLSGAFAIFILILGVALQFSDKGENMVFATVIAFIISTLIGLANFGWATTSLVIFFFGMIAFIGRARGGR